MMHIQTKYVKTVFNHTVADPVYFYADKQKV